MRVEEKKKMTNLLVELQTEELPPKALEKLSEAFAAGVEQHLRNRGFLAEGSVTTAYGSPRRLAVHISNVLEKSPDEAFTQKLVPVRVGLAADGSATPALVKKMNALGITCDVAELKRYYNVDIRFMDNRLRDMRFSGNFRVEDGIYHIMSVLQLTYKFNYRIAGNDIELYANPER